MEKRSSILQVANIFAQSVQEVVARFCQMEVTHAKTAQFIQSIQISNDIGSFVSFFGDYKGLMVLNFAGDAALELVTASLNAMGMPASEMPSHFLSDDVINSIGELTNHIIGKSRTNVQNEYDLASQANIPAVVPVHTPIGLVFKDGTNSGYECVRIPFRTAANNSFYMELTMEPAIFVSMETVSKQK